MATNAAPRHAARADPVERPRLFALLDQGSLGPVTLLCAPAGSGKTMLLSSWLGRGNLPGPVAWVAVDRGETDPTRFWGTVIDALRGSGAVGQNTALSTLLPSPTRSVEREPYRSRHSPRSCAGYAEGRHDPEHGGSP